MGSYPDLQNQFIEKLNLVLQKIDEDYLRDTFALTRALKDSYRMIDPKDFFHEQEISPTLNNRIFINEGMESYFVVEIAPHDPVCKGFIFM